MDLYLNPNADAFKDDRNTRIYIDKSLVIGELNQLVSTKVDLPKRRCANSAVNTECRLTRWSAGMTVTTSATR